MKAILVIDMPDSCFHCPLEHYGNQCGANHESTAGNANKRSSWCPLRPLLEFYQQIGKNLTIDEILGETE